MTTTTTTYTITVTITPPAITAVDLSATTLTTATAANAADFALTNGGLLPCNLVVGAANLAAGSYAVTLSATE